MAGWVWPLRVPPLLGPGWGHSEPHGLHSSWCGDLQPNAHFMLINGAASKPQGVVGLRSWCVRVLRKVFGAFSVSIVSWCHCFRVASGHTTMGGLFLSTFILAKQGGGTILAATENKWQPICPFLPSLWAHPTCPPSGFSITVKRKALPGSRSGSHQVT